MRMDEIVRVRIRGDDAIRTRSGADAAIIVKTGASNDYVLPEATETTLGGIKVGDALQIENGVLSVRCADAAEADNSLPITSAAVHAEVGNIAVLLSTI